MSDNIKLIIEIDKDRYNKIMNNAKYVCPTGLDSVIAGGIPLDDVLDKIEAEIKETRKRRNVGVMECLDIIDRYKAESEEI